MSSLSVPRLSSDESVPSVHIAQLQLLARVWISITDSPPLALYIIKINIPTLIFNVYINIMASRVQRAKGGAKQLIFNRALKVA